MWSPWYGITGQSQSRQGVTCGDPSTKRRKKGRENGPRWLVLVLRVHRGQRGDGCLGPRDRDGIAPQQRPVELDRDGVLALVVPAAMQKGTRVLVSLWDSLMLGRVPGTRPNMSESHSEVSTSNLVFQTHALGSLTRCHAIPRAQRSAHFLPAWGGGGGGSPARCIVWCTTARPREGLQEQ